MKNILVPFILLVVYTEQVFSARILVMAPFPGKSHHIFNTAIMKSLAARGHHLVEYSPYPPQIPIVNHTHVQIQTETEKMLDNWTFESCIEYSKGTKRAFGFKIENIWKMNYKTCEYTFQNEKIKKLLQSSGHFDLVITESTFGMECLLAFGHRFSAPTVTVEGFFPWSILNRDAGNDLSIASVLDLTSKAYFTKELLSFKERFLNFVSISLTLFFYHNSHIPKHDEIVKKHFDWPDTPSVAQMVSNVSLYLTNSHPTVINYVHPYSPNIIPIGGIHIPNSVPDLPQDLQRFMNEAKEGVIYFSFGTVVPAHLMPLETRNIFLKVFEKLPQKVLWKVNLDNINVIPQNVKIVKWAPQVAILKHPNCRLFITHGGLFSHHEATYTGVPTVGIPFFSDQLPNTKYREEKGIGVSLEFETISEETLYQSITTVLNNSKYKENAKRLARVYADRPLAPADSLVFWVEYVLRHGGAGHLRPAAAGLSWYQLALLDVAAVIVAVLVCTIAVIYTVLRMLFSFVCIKKNHVPSVGKKNN